jgi:hypothetical protein
LRRVVVIKQTKQKRAESGFHDMNPSTDEDEMASSDSHENDEEDDDDEDDSDPTAQRERIRRNHVWAIISLLEEQAKGPYHLMVYPQHTTNTQHKHTIK